MVGLPGHGGQMEERSVPESSDGAQEGAHLGH